MQNISSWNAVSYILRFVIAAALLAMAGMAVASPVCNVAQESWMSEPDFKKALEQAHFMQREQTTTYGECSSVDTKLL